jgi:hypothetical protein
VGEVVDASTLYIVKKDGMVCRKGDHFGKMSFLGESKVRSGYWLFRCDVCGTEVGLVVQRLDEVLNALIEQ